MASTRIYRTAGSPTNDKIWTISGWFKFHSNDGHVIFASDGNNNTSWTQSRWSSGRLELGSYSTLWLRTTRVFRDTNAWYHIMYVADSTQATASDRLKIYVNGVEETSFETDNRSSTTQNQSWGWNKNGAVNNIGGENASGYGNFSVSHFHNIDGTALTPSTFGSTDSTTGEWKINTNPTVSSYGNNGFFWLKNSIATTDHSPNSNTFTIGGTLTKTEDCPSNIFNTFNPLVKTPSSLSYSHGNTTLTTTNTQWEGAMTNIPLFGGKWYYECKYNTGGNIKLSVVGEQSDYSNFDNSNSSYGEYHGNGYGYQFNNSGADYLGNNNTSPNWSGGLSSNTGDKIYMVALDLDNGKIWYGADGTWFNDANGYTGNPSTGAYPHQTMTAQHLSEKPHIVTGSVEGSGMTGNWNFGNGYFGTSAISSEGTNASGIGKFEYDVPTGFTAISTKGLNE